MSRPKERQRAVVAHLYAVSLAGLLLGGTLAPASGAEGLTLGQTVERALSDGYGARIAGLEAAAADDSVAAARGAYLPHLSVVGRAGYSNRWNTKLRAVDRNGSQKTYPLSSLGSDTGWINVYVDQILFDLRRWRLVEREELAAEAARVAEAAARESVAFEVVQAYTALVRAEQRAQLAREHEIDAERLDADAEALLSGGRILAVERELVQIYREETRTDAEQSRGEVEDARAMLWVALGSGPHTQELALDATSLPEPDPALAPLEPSEDMVAEAPELRLLDLRRRMEETNVSATRAGRFPVVQLRGGYANYGPFRYDSYGDEVFVGVGLELPIFDGFENLNEVARAEKLAEGARLRYKAALDAKLARVRGLARRLETLARRVSLQERRATTALEQRRLANLNLRSDRARLDQALAAHEQAGRDASAAIASRFDWIDTWAVLQYEAGRLAATTLSSEAFAQTTPRAAD